MPERLIINDIPPATIIRPGIKTKQLTVVVSGMYRGGTSFVAETLIQCGVPMGESYCPVMPREDYCSYEDAGLAGVIDSRNIPLLPALIEERNAKHDIWGFKKPSAVYIFDRLLNLLRNPHLIVVLRDPLAAHQSARARGVVSPDSLSVPECCGHLTAVMDLLCKPRCPTLAISYERGKEQPAAMRLAIIDFLGLQ